MPIFIILESLMYIQNATYVHTFVFCGEELTVENFEKLKLKELFNIKYDSNPAL